MKNQSQIEQRLSSLLERWMSEGVRTNQPAAPDEVKAFERRYSVLLPPDLKRYFLVANGMYPEAPGDADARGFCFWPLQRVVSAFDEFRNNPIHRRDVLDPSLDSLFVFADYLQWCWAYAIRLRSIPDLKCEVVKVDEPSKVTSVADSFSEFLDLYAADSPRLYGAEKTL